MFAGQDLLQSSEKQLRSIRGKRISMIFQDPMTAFLIKKLFLLNLNLFKKS